MLWLSTLKKGDRRGYVSSLRMLPNDTIAMKHPKKLPMDSL